MTDHFHPPPFHPHRPGLVGPVKVDPTGLAGPTRSQARGSHWRRTSQGLYVPSNVDGDRVEQRILEAAAVIPAGRGAVTGWAALAWLGGRWFTGLARDGSRLPVQLAMWGDIRPRAQTTVCEEGIDPREVTVVDGLPITVPVRSVCFLMRYAVNDRDAVVALDMAAYNDLVSLEEIGAYAAAHNAWTGIPRCRKALPLADENSWSPQETRMRLVWIIDAGLPPPLCNVPVFDRAGRHLGTPDLLDPIAGVVGEYDGSLHLQGHQRRKDRDREWGFRRAGLEYFTVLEGDVTDRARLAARMIETRARAGFEEPSARAWTVDPPVWWTPTVTVEQRRALSGSQRARLLGLRGA